MEGVKNIQKGGGVPPPNILHYFFSSSSGGALYLWLSLTHSLPPFGRNLLMIQKKSWAKNPRLTKSETNLLREALKKNLVWYLYGIWRYLCGNCMVFMVFVWYLYAICGICMVFGGICVAFVWYLWYLYGIWWYLCCICMVFVVFVWYLYGIWYLVFGIWYLVVFVLYLYGICGICMIFVWYLVFGIWYLVFGMIFVWYFGIWYYCGILEKICPFFLFFFLFFEKPFFEKPFFEKLTLNWRWKITQRCCDAEMMFGWTEEE